MKLIKHNYMNIFLKRILKNQDVEIRRFFKDIYFISFFNCSQIVEILIIPYFYLKKYDYVKNLLKTLEFKIIISDNPKGLKNFLSSRKNILLYDDLTSQEYEKGFVCNDYKLNYVSTKIRLVQYAVYFKAKSIRLIDLAISENHKEIDKEYINYLLYLGLVDVKKM